MVCEVVECFCNNKECISESITIIVAILNLVFVVWFYFNDKKQKRKESLQSYKMTWYRSFDFKENIESLNNIFNNALINIIDIRNSDEKDINVLREKAKECINDFDKKIIYEKEKMLSILYCIDKLSGKILANKFNDVQDNFLQLVQKCTLGLDLEYVNVDEEFFEMKSTIIDCLYSIGLNFI